MKSVFSNTQSLLFNPSFYSYFVLSILGAAIFVACGNFQKPEFKGLENVRFNSVKLGQELALNLTGDGKFNNPNSVGVKISGLEVEAFVDGKKLSDIKQEISAEIPGKSEFSLPLTFQIPLKDIVSGFQKQGQFNPLAKREILIRLDGFLIFSTGNLDLRVPMVYEEPYELSLFSLIGQ